MGFLTSDLGFAIGQLAGALWSKNYTERGEQKNQLAEQAADRAQSNLEWAKLYNHAFGTNEQPDTHNTPTHTWQNQYIHFMTDPNGMQSYGMSRPYPTYLSNPNAVQNRPNSYLTGTRNGTYRPQQPNRW